MLVRDVAPDQALQINQEIPVADGPNPVASPFVFKGDKGARAQALQCLASAVYYEAGSQDDDGERAHKRCSAWRARSITKRAARTTTASVPSPRSC